MSVAAAADALSRRQRWFARVQPWLPTRRLSAFMFGVANVRNRVFKNALIRWFVQAYGVDLSEAACADPARFEHFNAFFTRALKPGARPQPADPAAFSSPVDGTVSQIGPVREGSLLQAKGYDYTVAELLTDHDLAAEFWDGGYCTLYLAPHNYHRVHMPCAGKLRQWLYVPGRLFSVNPATARSIPGLFARNERMVAVFDTEFGPLALVMVGALLVGGIETVWHGRVTPPHGREAQPSLYEPMRPLTLQRGDELGRFHMGSTVILLAPAGALSWLGDLAAGQPVRVGQELATMHPTQALAS